MRSEETDIRFYLGMIRRWWWVLALGVLTAAITALLLSRSMTPIYDASAKILVQQGQGFLPSASEIQASQQLAQSYSDLITTRPVMEEVIQRLSLSYTPQGLSQKLEVKAPRSLIVIGVTDPDPALAATIANEIAKVFIDRFREQQLLELARLQTSLADYGIAQDPQIIAAQATMASALTVVETAAPSLRPSSPNTRLNVLLGALLGLVIASGVVYLLERLDDSFKSPDELKDFTGLASLGSVFRWPPEKTGIPHTITDEHQRTSLAESFKFLTASLEFAAAASAYGLRTIMLTSASPSEGKTTTATNLAVALARQGKSVILVDADLRKPQMHRIFDISSTPGFTNLLLGSNTLEEALISTPVPGLRLMASGPLPPDPAQILRLPRIRESIAALRDNRDIVIFDAPPVLVVADALILAGLVDSAVLVVDTSRTSRRVVAQAVETLRQTPVNILGGVLNKIEAKSRGRYYYQYYYQYPSSPGDGAANGARKGLPKRVLERLTFGRLNGSSKRRRHSSPQSQASATSSSGDAGGLPATEVREPGDHI